jgi:hypothetical protein
MPSADCLVLVRYAAVGPCTPEDGFLVKLSAAVVAELVGRGDAVPVAENGSGDRAARPDPMRGGREAQRIAFQDHAGGGSAQASPPLKTECG